MCKTIIGVRAHLHRLWRRLVKKISAEAFSGKEIAGLLKKMMMMKNMMTRKIVKFRMRGFSRGKLEAGMNELGICIARYESKSSC